MSLFDSFKIGGAGAKPVFGSVQAISPAEVAKLAGECAEVRPAGFLSWARDVAGVAELVTKAAGKARGWGSVT